MANDVKCPSNNFDAAMSFKICTIKNSLKILED